jgi:hypothetical protein
MIQYGSYLFTWKLNNPEANYKFSTSKKNEKKHSKTKCKTK